MDDKGAQGERAGRRGEQRRADWRVRRRSSAASNLGPTAIVAPRGWADWTFGKHSVPQVWFCFGLGRVGLGEDVEDSALESEEAGGYELCALVRPGSFCVLLGWIFVCVCFAWGGAYF